MSALEQRLTACSDLIDSGAHQAAERMLREILREHPHAVGAWSLLGFAALRESRLDEAEESARVALENDPEYTLVHRLLGAIALERGELEAAITHHERAIELDPDDVFALTGLAAALHQADRPLEAVAALEDALELDDELVGAWAHLASLHAQTGDDKLAAELIATALRLGPDDPDAHRSAAWIALRQQRLSDALLHARAVLRVDPADLGALETAAFARAAERFGLPWFWHAVFNYFARPELRWGFRALWVAIAAAAIIAPPGLAYPIVAVQLLLTVVLMVATGHASALILEERVASGLDAEADSDE